MRGIVLRTPAKRRRALAVAGAAFGNRRSGSKRRLSVRIGIPLLLVVLVMTLAPSLLAPADPIAQNLGERLRAPSLGHPFGTDDFGRDILSRVIYGTRISLVIAVVVVVASAIIGTAVGTLAGWRGGWLDEILMRGTDVFMAFPNILLPMIVVVALGTNLVNTTLALTLVWWAPYARVIRGQVLSTKENPYIDSARVLGADQWRIIRRYIWPNALPPFLALATMDLGFVILTAAGLGFLGLGAQQPTPEWGLMISDGLPNMLDAWWCTVFPGAGIAITVLAFNLLGDALQDHFSTRR